MAQFTVTVAELNTKAEALEQLNAQFMNQVKGLQDTEASLNGMWEGEARMAFHNAFTNDSTQMTNFYNTIAQYVVALRNIAVKYQNAEAINVETANVRKYQ